jgi:hypothetical protein
VSFDPAAGVLAVDAALSSQLRITEDEVFGADETCTTNLTATFRARWPARLVTSTDGTAHFETTGSPASELVNVQHSGCGLDSSILADALEQFERQLGGESVSVLTSAFGSTTASCPP